MENPQKNTWYSRNREHCLEVVREYKERNEEKIKAYQRQYYQKRKALMPPKPLRVPQAKPLKPAISPATDEPKKKTVKFLTSERKRYGSRKPKEFYEYTPKEDLTLGWIMNTSQREKLLENCPKGFFQDERKNPFFVDFR